jgi:hypothetical protein
MAEAFLSQSAWSSTRVAFRETLSASTFQVTAVALPPYAPEPSPGAWPPYAMSYPDFQLDPDPVIVEFQEELRAAARKARNNK